MLRCAPPRLPVGRARGLRHAAGAGGAARLRRLRRWPCPRLLRLLPRRRGRRRRRELLLLVALLLLRLVSRSPPPLLLPLAGRRALPLSKAGRRRRAPSPPAAGAPEGSELGLAPPPACAALLLLLLLPAVLLLLLLLPLLLPCPIVKGPVVWLLRGWARGQPLLLRSAIRPRAACLMLGLVCGRRRALLLHGVMRPCTVRLALVLLLRLLCLLCLLGWVLSLMAPPGGAGALHGRTREIPQQQLLLTPCTVAQSWARTPESIHMR